MSASRNNEILRTTIDENGIFRLTLDHQRNHNALSEEMMLKIQAALDESVSNTKIRVIIISADGPTFSAGHDLKELTKGRENPDKGKNYFTSVMNKCSKLMQTIVNNPKPVIAEVNGTATAAGCQLVASCDLAFASKNSFFQTPGVNIGLFCSTPMVAISRKVLIKDMMYMLLSGDKISALEAEKIRLINKVFIKKHLKKEVMNIAIKITRKSNQSIKIGKEAFYKQLDMNIEKAYDYTSKVMTKNMGFNEAKEGIQAFIEKRKPNWKN